MGGGHLYDWLRDRGYWLPPAHLCTDERPAAPTHLFLDGGRARVPDESHAAFLNAYAASLARAPGRRPCAVELRTPVFRMFLDLDTRFAGATEAAAAARGTPLRGLFARLSALLAPEPDAPPPRALVCAASGAKAEAGGCVKLGFHVVWPEVLVTAGTALELRRRMVEDLAGVDPASLGLACGWESIVDASVFRANGLRMPWSGKGRGDDRYYELRWVLTAAGALEPAEAASVSALRDALRQLSVRTFSRDPTLRLLAPAGGEAGGEDDCSAPVVAKSLAAYADVLPALAAALPPEFRGQKFTALMATEHCFMLRSTARFCFNACREHCTSNVYFTLTRRGVCQRCYCRKDTAEGRKFGQCKDFVSDSWQVPKGVLDAFFPPDDEPAEPPAKAPQGVATMPSRTAKSFLKIEALMARSRPQLPSPAGKRRRAKA